MGRVVRSLGLTLIALIAGSCERSVTPAGEVSANVTSTTLAASQDTYVELGAPPDEGDPICRGLNHGGEVDMFVGKSPHTISLVQFATEQIESAAAAGTGLISAQLTIYVGNASTPYANCASPYEMHAITHPWDEAHATWDCANDPTVGSGVSSFGLGTCEDPSVVPDPDTSDCPAGEAWSWEDPDPALRPYDAAAVDSVTCSTDASGNTTLVFDVTATVASILAGAPNHGWAVIDTNTLRTELLTIETSESGHAPMLTIVTSDATVFAPLEPDDVPTLDPSTPTHVLSAMRWLFQPDRMLQLGERRSVYDIDRAAVLRGRVFHRDTGAELAGVDVHVLGHPEYGHAVTRIARDGVTPTGVYELLINGGGQLVLEYTRDGFLTAQRTVDVPWNSWLQVPDIALVPAPTACTAASVGLIHGPLVDDVRGRRIVGAYVPAATGMTDGRSCTSPADCGAGWTCVAGTCTTSTYDVCLEELTRAPARAGMDPTAAMPGELPATTSYTFAATARTRVGTTYVDHPRFAGNVALHVILPDDPGHEFVQFPVGSILPTGIYDTTVGAWRASGDGGVYGIDHAGGDQGCLVTMGLPLLPTDEVDAICADPSYQTGARLWRTAVDHFSYVDLNALAGLFHTPPRPRATTGPIGSCGPAASGPSVIHCESRALGESLPITGSPFDLTYTSSNQWGRRDAYRVDFTPIPGELPSGDAVPVRVSAELLAAGQVIPLTTELTELTQMQSAQRLEWDGNDVYGRRMVGPERAYLRVGYTYELPYRAPPGGDRSFGRPPSSGAASLGVDGTVTYYVTLPLDLGTLDDRIAGIGGFRIDAHHVYDPATHTLFLGDGNRRRTDTVGNVVVSVAPAGPIDDVRGVTVGPDGTLYYFTLGDRSIHVVPTDGRARTIRVREPDGSPAAGADLVGLSVGRNGLLYAADVAQHCIRALDLGAGPAGVMATVLGQCGAAGSAGPTADGPLPQVSMVRLNSPSDVVTGRDGSIYVADSFNDRVLRVLGDSFGASVELVVGDVTCVEGLDRAACQPARTVRYLAIAPDGTLYMDRLSPFGFGITEIAAVAPDGTFLVVVGNDHANLQESALSARSPGALCGPTDWDPACASVAALSALTVTPDGDICWAGEGVASAAVRCLRGPESRVFTFAGAVGGGDHFPPTAESAPAARTDLGDVGRMAFSPDGRLYFHQNAGAGTRALGVRVIRPSLEGGLESDHVIPSADGDTLFVFDGEGRHMRTVDAISNHVLLQFAYDRATGLLTTVRDAEQRELQIVRPAPISPSGTSVDLIATGSILTRLTLADDDPGDDVQGRVIAVQDPSSAGWGFDYESMDGGLLSSMTVPATPGHSTLEELTHRYSYDPDGGGLLEQATNSIDRVGDGAPTQHITEAAVPNGTRVDLASPESRHTSFDATSIEDAAPEDTGLSRRRSYANGFSVTQFLPSDGGATSTTLRWDDGVHPAASSVLTSDWTADPRYGGLDASYPSSTTLTRPFGDAISVQRTRATDTAGTIYWTTLTDTTVIGGASFQSVIDRHGGRPRGSGTTQTLDVPSRRMDRQVQLQRDSSGRLVEIDLPGQFPVCLSYTGPHRRPDSIAQASSCSGAGSRGGRRVEFTYADSHNPHGAPWLTEVRVQDVPPMVTTITPDARGLADSVQLPGRSSLLDPSYDAHGNLIALQTPGHGATEAYAFGYTGRDLPQTYARPSGPQISDTTYTLDGLVGTLTLPGARSISATFLPSGDIDHVDGADEYFGVTSYTFHTSAGRPGGDEGATPAAIPLAASGPGGSYSVGWDGALLTQEAWARADADTGVDGSIVRTIDGLGLVSEEVVTIEGRAQTMSPGYDVDRVLNAAGITGRQMTITTGASAPARATLESSFVQTQAGTIVTHAGATPYGERLDVTTRAGTGGPVLFEEHVCTRDPVGRVTSREESWRDTPAGGLGTRLYVYTYDSAGRLRTYEERAGTCASPGALRSPRQTWTYDDAGNRSDLGTPSADDEVTLGGRHYDAMGRLDSMTPAGGAPIGYHYDVFGRLRSTTDAEGETRYDYDPRGRLVAIRPAAPTNTNPTQRFVYGDALEPVAWQSTVDGGLTRTAWFVYATAAHVPDMMYLDGDTNGTLDATYRFVTDERGSVRGLVLVSTTGAGTPGATVQRIEYDAWGNPDFGTSALLQPFGFAGGIWLAGAHVWHFGARDYDPSIGRWTAPDPIGFEGGLNLHGYCGDDPVNCADPDGTNPIILGAIVGGILGGAANAIGDPCADVGSVLISAAFGAAGGALAGALVVGGAGPAAQIAFATFSGGVLGGTQQVTLNAYHGSDPGYGVGSSIAYGAAGGLLGGLLGYGAGRAIGGWQTNAAWRAALGQTRGSLAHADRLTQIARVARLSTAGGEIVASGAVSAAGAVAPTFPSQGCGCQ